jgi:hypothetical protein
MRPDRASLLRPYPRTPFSAIVYVGTMTCPEPRPDMRRRQFIGLVGGVVTAWPLAAARAIQTGVDIWGLLSCGADPGDLFCRAAGLVDKVLKAQSPGTCRSSSQQNSNWSATSRLRRRSASPLPHAAHPRRRGDRVKWREFIRLLGGAAATLPLAGGFLPLTRRATCPICNVGNFWPRPRWQR